MSLINNIITTADIIKKRNFNLHIVGIVISFSGPVDFKGTVRFAPSLWGDIFKDYPFKMKLASVAIL